MDERVAVSIIYITMTSQRTIKHRCKTRNRIGNRAAFGQPEAHVQKGSKVRSSVHYLCSCAVVRYSSFRATTVTTQMASSNDISEREKVVSVPDPNPPQHGSHLVSRAGREGLVNLLHKN